QSEGRRDGRRAGQYHSFPPLVGGQECCVSGVAEAAAVGVSGGGARGGVPAFIETTKPGGAGRGGGDRGGGCGVAGRGAGGGEVGGVGAGGGPCGGGGERAEPVDGG